MGKAFDKISAGLREVRKAINSGTALTTHTALLDVTRVALIDHSQEGEGLAWEKRELKDVMISIQDEGRTLKVFVR
jgi:hypothetical protein